MIQVVVTGQIVMSSRSSSAASEKSWGIFWMKATFWRDGAQFARLVEVWVPSYCGKSADALVKEQKYIGVVASDMSLFNDRELIVSGKPYPVVSILADKLFIL